MDYVIDLKTEADFEISTSQDTDPLNYKNLQDDSIISNAINFSSTFQIRKHLSTPMHNVQTRFQVPSHLRNDQGETIQIMQLKQAFITHGMENSKCIQSQLMTTEDDGSIPLSLIDHQLSCQTRGILCTKIK